MITFEWLVLASTLGIVLDCVHGFSLSPGLARSVCEQSGKYAEMNQLQAPLKSSSMAPKSESGSDCEWVVMNKPQPPVLKPCSSSASQTSGLISPRVVNGEPTEPGEFPSLITIYIWYSEYPFNQTYEIPANWDIRCGGVLVNEEWVFTLKDCFRIPRDDQNLSRVRIYAGKFNHTPGTDQDVEQGPSEPYEFVDYPYDSPEPDPKEWLRLDFTLAKVKPPFRLTDRVQPARWPKADDGIPKDPVTIVGWGVNSTDNYEKTGTTPYEFIPHKKTMNVMDQQKCIDVLLKRYAYNISDSEFCLEDPDGKISGPRMGDDVMYQTNAEGQQVFIAADSFWFHDLELPPVVTRTSYLREWVESVVGKLP